MAIAPDRVYLVTGGAGLIGTELTRALLSQGCGVRVLDDLSVAMRLPDEASVELIVASCEDEQVLQRALRGVHGCFHLAGDVLHVLRGATRAGRVPVVIASSAAVYGHHSNEAIHESEPVMPVTGYGEAKLAAERAAQEAFAAVGLPSLCLRFFNVYGSRPNACSPLAGVVTRLLLAWREGRPFVIEGDGLQTRDFLHAQDAADCMLRGMAWLECEGGRAVLNACSGQPTTVLALAEMLGDLTEARQDIVYCAPRSNEIRYSWGCPAMAEALLGFRATIDLRSGLARVMHEALPFGWDGRTTRPSMVVP